MTKKHGGGQLLSQQPSGSEDLKLTLNRRLLHKRRYFY